MAAKKEMVAMLLAGGQGNRLYVLTNQRAKPAVPFGGKYRIIDFTLSNPSASILAFNSPLIPCGLTTVKHASFSIKI